MQEEQTYKCLLCGCKTNFANEGVCPECPILFQDTVKQLAHRYERGDFLNFDHVEVLDMPTKEEYNRRLFVKWMYESGRLIS